MVGRPSRLAGSGPEALLECWERLESSPGGPGVVRRISCLAENLTLVVGREWLGGPPEEPGVVGRPSWWAGSGQ